MVRMGVCVCGGDGACVHGFYCIGISHGEEVGAPATVAAAGVHADAGLGDLPRVGDGCEFCSKAPWDLPPASLLRPQRCAASSQVCRRCRSSGTTPGRRPPRPTRGPRSTSRPGTRWSCCGETHTASSGRYDPRGARGTPAAAGLGFGHTARVFGNCRSQLQTVH